MKKTEYREFENQLSACFPDVGAMYANGGQLRAEAWYLVLEHLQLADCLKALQVILSGSEPFPQPMSTFPGAVKRIALRFAMERARSEEQIVEKYPSRGRYSMGQLWGCAVESLDAGMNPEQALAEMNRRYPVADEDMVRYACMACEDTGHVKIFHNNTAAAVWRGDAKVRKYSAVVMCNCKAGKRRHTDSSGNEVQITYTAIYDPDKFCRYRNGDIDGLRLWIEKKRELIGARQEPLKF